MTKPKTFEELEREFLSLNKTLDHIEDIAESLGLAPEKTKLWMHVWKKSVKLKSEMYQLAFPTSSVEFNEGKTQFKVVIKE